MTIFEEQVVNRAVFLVRMTNLTILAGKDSDGYELANHMTQPVTSPNSPIFPLPDSDGRSEA